MYARGKRGCLLINEDGQVLQLWSETFAVRKKDDNMVWMIYYSHAITGDECGICLRTEEKHRKNLNQEIEPMRWGFEPGPAAWDVRCYPYTTAVVRGNWVEFSLLKGNWDYVLLNLKLPQ